jgi:rare lipoprotein A
MGQFGRASLALAGAAFLLLPTALPSEAADPWYMERGTASWYGERFHGLQTASGEVFDMNQLTAAHRELPFGAEVTVVHLRTGASVSVVINDRGPCIDGRDIDLSKAAARALGMVDEGLAPVMIEADLQQLAHAGRSETRVSSGC